MLTIREILWFVGCFGIFGLAEQSFAQDLQAQVYFTSPTVSFLENCGRGMIAVSRDGDISKTASVDIFSSDLSATNGVDFRFTPVTLAFNPGKTQAYVPIGILDNAIVQSNRTFVVYLTNAINVNISEPASMVVTIVEDDYTLGVVEIEDLCVVENCDVAQVKIKRSGTLQNTAAVTFTSVNGTALAGKDYTQINRTVRLYASYPDQIVNVPILENTTIEGSRTFTVMLSNPVECTIGRSNATITIRDDDRHFFPRAKIEPVGEGLTRVLWPTNAPDLQLQTCQDLLHWSPVTNGGTLLSTNFCLTNNTVESCRFYRMDQK